MKVLWASKTIIDALKEDNAQLRNKVELLGKNFLKLKFLVIILNNIQGEIYIEIQSIPSKIPDEKLENKVIEIFGAMNIAITIVITITKTVLNGLSQTWQKFKNYYCPACE